MAAAVARDGPQATTAPHRRTRHHPARYPAGALPQEIAPACPAHFRWHVGPYAPKGIE